MRALLLLLLLANAVAAGPIAEDPQPHPTHPPALAEISLDSDGARLPGLIYLANGPGPHPTVLLLHGLPGNEKNLDIAQSLRRHGFNVLFFHYSGAWGAEGSYSLLQLDDDVLAALAFLRRPENAARFRVDVDRLSLLGHSAGGFAALLAGSEDSGLRCVGALSPVNFAVLVEGLAQGSPAAEGFLHYADGLYMLQGFDGEAMRRQLLAAPAGQLDTTRFGPGLRGKHVFLIVGDRDTVTPAAEHFDPVVEAYGRDARIALRHRVLEGDHAFSWSRIALTRLVLDWFGADCR